MTSWIAAPPDPGGGRGPGSAGGVLSAWFGQEPDPTAAARIVCFPHAGGSPATFWRWRQRLAGTVEVLAVRLPGRFGHRAPAATGLSALAARAAKAVALLGDRPVALLGHSFGAALAFACASELEAFGVPPVLVVVSGKDAPGAGAPSRLHRAGDDELAAELARLGGTPAAVLADPELRAALLPLVRADLRLLAAHPAGAATAVSCPILALAAVDDPTTSVAGVERWPSLGGAGSEVRWWPGGHFFLFAGDGPLGCVEDRLPGAPTGRTDRWRAAAARH